MLLGEAAADDKDAVDVAKVRVVGVVDSCEEKQAASYSFLHFADGAPGYVAQVKVFKAVLALGIRAYHKFVKEGAPSGPFYLAVKCLFVCLPHVGKDVAGHFFTVPACHMGKIL